MIADEFMFKPIKELECKVCGTKFAPLNENRYTIKRVNFFTKAEEECDAFDCPICGCQIVANTRYPKKYDSVEVDSDRLKKNLKKDIDMLKCDESTLSKMQMAIDDFGIKKEGDEYVYKGSRYDWYQMSQIRIGLMNGTDTSIYADPKYNADQMREIRVGLEKGLDVLIYINPKFDWKQMEQIRIGLKRRLDVSVYANPKYNANQMRDIRVGLEKGK